jgi:hypothetical protein
VIYTLLFVLTYLTHAHTDEYISAALACGAAVAVVSPQKATFQMRITSIALLMALVLGAAFASAQQVSVCACSARASPQEDSQNGRKGSR